jgi:hypothetical protein
MRKPDKALVVGLGSMGARYTRLLDEGHHIQNILLSANDCPAWAPNTVTPESLLLALQDGELAGIDIAVIATPADNHMHYLEEIAKGCPKAAILVEKPLSAPLAADPRDPATVELRLLSRTIAVGYNWRFHPWYKSLKARASEIETLDFYVADEMSRWPGSAYSEPLYEFSHELDMVRGLLREVEVASVVERGGRIIVEGVHFRGSWRVVIRHAGTARGRWARVRFSDGWRMAGAWPTGRALIAQTYRESLSDLVGAWQRGDGPEALVVPFSDALQTSEMLHRINKYLYKRRGSA